MPCKGCSLLLTRIPEVFAVNCTQVLLHLHLIMPAHGLCLSSKKLSREPVQKDGDRDSAIQDCPGPQEMEVRTDAALHYPGRFGATCQVGEAAA